MDQKIVQEFRSRIEKEISEFLRKYGFQYTTAYVLDEGLKVFVVFESSDLKLAFYHAEREGEINCLLAPTEVASSPDLDDRGSGWYFLYGLLYGDREPSLEELLRDNPDVKSTNEQLRDIAVKLTSNMDLISSEVARRKRLGSEN